MRLVPHKVLQWTLLAAAGHAMGAEALAPTEFAWRATLELPAGANAARVVLPGEALQGLQSSDARDVRVFNANGEAVAFALSRPAGGPAAPAVLTQTYPAFGLFANAVGRAPAGAVQIRIDAPGGQRTVWVQLDRTAEPVASAGTAAPVQSAVFATRNEKQLLGAINVQAELPANVLVQVTVTTSPDLAQWSPVAVRGRLYRFEGVGAPANMTLEFEQPVQLEGRYLRLSWHGYDGVRISALSATAAQAKPMVARERAPLPVATQSGRDTLEWSLDFATPLAALSLVSTRANTLVPVRVLGRVDAAQPWRELGRTVVYRLGGADTGATNPPLALNHPSVRQLRVVAGNGLELDRASLQASAEFDPVQVVFVATGAPPYTLAAGRAGTSLAALGSATMASVMPGKLDDLPVARITSVVQLTSGASRTWLDALTGGVGGRGAVLWMVLVAGVLLLAGVALTLLRKVSTARTTGPRERNLL